MFSFFEFCAPRSSVIFPNPIWIKDYENYVSTSLVEWDYVSLEVLNGIQNTLEVFGEIEEKSLKALKILDWRLLTILHETHSWW